MFGSLPRVPPQKCRFERPLAERRKTGTDPVKPLVTFRCRRLRHVRGGYGGCIRCTIDASDVGSGCSSCRWSVAAGEVDVIGGLVDAHTFECWVPESAAGVLAVLHVAH